MSNGCICCTLREDLLEEVARLAQEDRFDYLLIESTGISEPMPVAATFLFEDIEGRSLSSMARLDTMVSVVDAATFLDRFEVLEELHEMGVGRDDEDDRSVTDLLVDQIEFANVLVISKPDLVDAHKLERVVATVRQLNPEAQLVVAEKGDLPLDTVLDTGLFDEELGEVNPGWVQALNDEPTPETEEYGITSFVYRHRWPFHPKRLAKALEGDWSGVLRSKGFFWLATRPDVQAMWSQAGLSVMLEPLAEWMAAVPESEWEFETPEDRIAFDERWDPIVGDRQTEIVFIGIDMDEDEIRHRLDDCVLTGREFEKGPQKWTRFKDPLPEWDLSCELDLG
jgi:G3E family GTPase